ncbi:uncharacterized protein NDAI_0A07780 [Naumovozyma dairenensis CBS 421]|uniref:Thioesterase domain-containing protein n=1 Tax=Naumovozyma dairenensis (strain ATCC 10597 / BCRC 20456 / CBS 421 / NBRC 0211 / NRRL Y-12639) TaxID=1071378 RepID=G0W544_NAUDC|nr:hypothetical protein NDAI_0A07780 [Naumovozyma dairenensis CBS 421]CCD22932.1 hypothetical protein NDAI_0A07780 [Naumovozyma dairenensis CBS 421]
MSVLLNILKWVFITYLVTSYKSIPGAYFIRFYYHAFRLLLLPSLQGKKTTTQIERLQKDPLGCFALSRLRTYVSPLECDFYFHKNNCTYFTDLDISRSKLMCAIFQKLFLNSKRYPFVPVANVFTNFLKELKPMAKYNVVTSVLCWDEKWLYVISRFTQGKKDDLLCSLSLTKYVLKDGRKTIKPRDALEICGLYNLQVEEISAKNLKILTEECGFHETRPLENLEFPYMELND